MRVFIHDTDSLRHAPIAGIAAGRRMEQQLSSLSLTWSSTPSLARDEAEPIAWIHGLFPFLRLTDLLTLRGHAEKVGVAFCPGSGSPEAGIAVFNMASSAAERYLVPGLNWSQCLSQFTQEQRVPLDSIHTQVLDSPRRFSILNDYAYQLTREAAIDGGALLLDPPTTWIDESVALESGSLIAPNVHLRGNSRIGSGAEIQTGVIVIDSIVHAGALIKAYSVVDQSEIEGGASVGPFANIRPGCHLAEGVRVGNFVETKKAQIGPNSKASHLSYLGDVTIGRDCNIGAGTITCNYDGFNKHQTVLGDGVFIGSDSQLVAPVTLGDGAYVGAGSTITRNVDDGDLAISRARQSNKTGWAQKIREKAKRNASKDATKD